MDIIIIVASWLGALLAILAASAHALGRAHGRISRLEAKLEQIEESGAGRLELLAAHCRGLDRRIREAKSIGREAAAAAGTALVAARAEIANLREAGTARMDAVQARIDGLEEAIGVEPAETEEVDA